jgi:polysaccharide pyruvyl transferase WcaK-like protein
LLLEVTAQNIQKRFPESYIQAIGFYPAQITCQQGFYAIGREDKFKIDRMLSGASCLLFCGGIVHDLSQNRTAGLAEMFYNPAVGVGLFTDIALMAKMHAVPVVLHGIGAGPLENEDAKKIVRLWADNSALVTARDAITYDYFRQAGASQNLYTKADIIFTLGNEKPADRDISAYVDGDRTNILVSLRQWPHTPESFYENLAAVFDGWITEKNVHLVFLPFQWSDAAQDQKAQEQVLALMREKGHVSFYSNTGDYEEAIALINACDYTVGMRLHASILAHTLNKPCIGLDYNDKITAHYAQLGMQDYLLPLNFTPQMMRQAFERLVKEDTKALKGQVRVLREKAAEAITMANDIIESQPPRGFEKRFYYANTLAQTYKQMQDEYKRKEKGHIKKLEEERNNQKTLRQQIKTLEDKNRRIEGLFKQTLGSKTYRLGEYCKQIIKNPLKVFLIPVWGVRFLKNRR